MLAYLGSDFRRIFRPAQAAGVLHHQGFEIDAVDDVERIERVAFALRHLGAFGIADHAVDIDVAKWHATGEVRRHHHHACDPEKDDVVAGDEHG